MIVTTNSIKTDDNVLILEENSKQIKLYGNSKMIVTNKFVTIGSNIYPANTPIPVVYFMCNPTDTTPVVLSYNYDTLEFSFSGPCNYNPEAITPANRLDVKMLMSSPDARKTFYMSQCTSGTENSATSHESNYYRQYQGFDKTFYNLSRKPPTIRQNDSVVPATSNSYGHCTVSGNTITVTVNPGSTSFVGQSYFSVYMKLNER